MNILVIAPDGLYQKPSDSFIHNQLKEFVKLGHRVLAIVPIAILKRNFNGKRIYQVLNPMEIDGVSILYVGYLSMSSLGKDGFNITSADKFVSIFCMNKIKAFNADLIWTHSFGFGAKIGQTLKEALKVPLILTTHGGDTEFALVPSNVSKTRKSAASIDKIICVSPKLQRMLKEIGIENTECIINGFNDCNVQFIEKKPFRMVQVGHLIESKHFDISIKALYYLQKRGYDLKFDIIGEGNKKSYLIELVKELGLENNIKFYGYVNNSDVMRIMAEAQFFVMPSFPEGLGVVYLEAMASRCVTIGTKGEGIDGIIIDGVNGFLVDKNNPNAIADNIEKCLINTRLMEHITENAHSTAMKYTWEANAVACCQAAKQLINM